MIGKGVRHLLLDGPEFEVHDQIIEECPVSRQVLGGVRSVAINWIFHLIFNELGES